MPHLQLCVRVYTVKTKLYKQASGYSELPTELASGNLDKIETVGNEQRQRWTMKTEKKQRGRILCLPHLSGSCGK